MISDLDIALRLLVAAVLGALIGFERERLMWAAGIRTHMLVAVGSCLLMIVSAYGFQRILTQPHVVLDPSRIAAQVVTGIGFLGAGSIILRGQAVRGLTTAASVWAVAAIGLAAGGQLYFAACAATIIILVILAGIKPVEEAYRRRVQTGTIEINAERDTVTLDNLKGLSRLRVGQLRRVVIRDQKDGSQCIIIQLTRVSSQEIEIALRRLRAAPGITSVDLTKKRRAA